jgi:hypothetical protein
LEKQKREALYSQREHIMQEKSSFVMALSDPSAGLEQVGGKGASLARMTGAGLSVPPGLHITTAAYRRFVAEHALQEQILAAVSVVTPDTLTMEKAAGRIIRRETAKNQTMTIRAEAGTCEVPVPASQKKERC